MSWTEKCCDTYDACEDIVGICNEEEGTVLLPLGHMYTELNAIVYLDCAGSLQRMEKIEGCDSNVKNGDNIFMPCTEESASRSGKGASKFPHPLFDRVKYLCSSIYLENLKQWITYLERKEEYTAACRIISAIYCYISQGTLINDLISYRITDSKGNVKKDWNIGFCVNAADGKENRLWKMPDLWRAWNDFYSENYVNKRKKDVCYATGRENLPYSSKHPKKINIYSANAKLISGNDQENFTFRGRFETPSEAVTISYEASQKVHQTLRWLISKPNCYRCDTQAIIAWAIDKVPEILSCYEDSYGIYKMEVQNDPEKLRFADHTVYADYSQALKNLLLGYNSFDKIKRHIRQVVVMAVDSSTDGRMAVTYYRELREDEYEERLVIWHDTCKSYQRYDKETGDFGKTGYFIGAPSMNRITLAVLGTRKAWKSDASYNKIVRILREQLLHCIFDGDKIPQSMVNAAFRRAINPLALENTVSKNREGRWRNWEYVLGTACALIKRYYHDYKKEEYEVKLEESRSDRDYLYGRLLAVADQIEMSARYRQGKTKEDARATNAMRYMTAFSMHPFRTWNMLFSQQLNPYLVQLDGGGRYLKEIGLICNLFEAGAYESDAPLDGRFLLGFFAQRQKNYKE
ncbi:MAG: type I-C CRISPR-associated protein Cas8c/Csd1 [Eisenbergiella sp.]